MDCDKIKILLVDYQDSELDAPTISMVEAHLEDCPDCTQALKDLNFYQSILSKVDPVKSPEDLRDKILVKTQQDKGKLHVPFRQTAFYKIGRFAAAAVLILAILIIPAINQPAQIEISYSKKVVKKGKGSPEEKRETAEVRMIREMSELSNGKLVHVQSNEKTGLVDYIEIRIPKADYKTFAEYYNQEDNFEALPAETPGGIRKNLTIRIYYPGRRFVTGDFNGDGRDDILAHYFRGKNQGSWFLSTNSVDSFAMPEPIRVNEILQYVNIPNQLISGDFNNDGFDDLMVGFYNNSFPADWSLVLNDKQGNFYDRHDLVVEDDSISAMGPYIAYAADINGDRADELVIHFLDGELFDQWYCFVNMGNLKILKPEKLSIINMNDTLAGMSKVFLMDYNGDKRDDMLIYWKRKHDPEWWISINQGNLQMGTSFVITRAYQGAYYPYILDFNGDGYDEMIVKEGAEDMFGGWYLWKNENGGTFRWDRSINFAGDINFLVE
jgi:hypothetical protein